MPILRSQHPRATLSFPALLRICAVVGVATALAMPAPRANAQVLKTNNARAVVASLGRVMSLTALASQQRTPTEARTVVTSTVTTVHNGPYKLQVKLAQPFGNDTVYVKNPSDVYAKLSTTAWVTAKTGPGGKGKVNPLEYLVTWGKSGSRSKKAAEGFLVTYQVVPQ